MMANILGGEYSVHWINVVDFLIVVMLVYQLYRLLRGSLAFNIFLGLVVVYVVFFLVRYLKMPILSSVLKNFIDLGILAIIVIFQPEIRRFLLLIGKRTPFSRDSFFMKLLQSDRLKSYREEERMINELITALEHLSASSTGALIILAHSYKMKFDTAASTLIDGTVSAKLIESIFEKNSPLHDGALIIAGNRILAAKVILPISDNPDLPTRIGLRHRSAVGATEHSDSIALIVSEEKGTVSYAKDGKLYQDVGLDELKIILLNALTERGS